MVNIIKRIIHKKIKKFKKKVAISLFLISLLFIVFLTYKNAFIDKKSNILWLNHLYQSEVINKFYMVYDDDVIDDIDSLTLSENLSEERLKVIRKSISKAKEVSAFRSKYKNNDILIFKEAKNKINRYKIKENNLSIDLVYFRENNLTPQLKFSSENCNLEIKSEESKELEKFFNDVSECIYIELKKLNAGVIMIGPDHAYTDLLSRIIKKHKPNTKLGFILFYDNIYKESITQTKIYKAIN